MPSREHSASDRMRPLGIMRGGVHDVAKQNALEGTKIVNQGNLCSVAHCEANHRYSLSWPSTP